MSLNFRHVSWIGQSNWFLFIFFEKIWSEIWLFFYLIKPISFR